MQSIVKMMILENNGEPFTENGEPIISKLLTLNRLVRTINPNLFCTILEINGDLIMPNG